MANIKWSAFTDGGEMQVNDQTVGLRAGDNRRFNFPGTGIKDVSANYLVGWASAGALAVNYLQFNSAVAASPPFIIPTGVTADIGLLLKSKGNGDITLTPSGIGIILTTSALILNTNAPTTPLQAASKGYVDSLAPSYPISLANGGTSAALIANNGGIFYSTATAGAILAGTATANQVLLSGLSSAPSWSTAVYPATTTINQLLYSGAANVISGLTTANSGVLVTSNTGVPSILATPGTTGNMLRSNTAAAPSWSTAIFADTYAINTILYASSANNIMGLATANNGVLITSAGGMPSISSTLPAAVQGNITAVGTITSGTWNGTIISPVYGGTGINNGTSTLTLGGSLTTVGAFTSTFTMTGTTSVTFPTSGTLATTGAIPSFPLSLANGGTGAALVAANGGIVYSNATTLAILAPTATANQLLMSGSNTTPAWSTATYPATAGTSGTILTSNGTNIVNTTATYPSVATTTGTILRADGTNWLKSTSTFADTYAASTLLYSNGANTVTGLATANSAVLVTSSTGVPAWSGTMTNGQLIIGSTGATPTAATLTAGTGISITNAAGSITIASSASGMSWTTVSGTTQAAAVNNGYISNNAGAVTFTLPITFAIGESVEIKGLGAGGWVLAAGTATTIRIGNSVTSSAGSLTSANQYDTVSVIGLVANTTWSVDYALSTGLTVA